MRGVQMNLLDRAVKMVAELDEPVEMNYVRKHAQEQAEELGVSLREAATRVFSNASGSYSSNVNLAVENASWTDEKQLQDMYLSRKSFAFDSDAPGAGMKEKRKAFELALATADATFQNLDSSEISLTDVSHYFDSDPTKLVQGLQGWPGAFLVHRGHHHGERAGENAVGDGAARCEDEAAQPQVVRGDDEEWVRGSQGDREAAHKHCRVERNIRTGGQLGLRGGQFHVHRR